MPDARHRVIRFGRFEFDLDEEELRRAGLLLRLPPQPAKLLGLLLVRAGEVVTRDEIQGLLWPDGTFVDYEQGINHTIRQIRVVLGDDAISSRFVQTVPRVGYRFFAGVEWVAGPTNGHPSAGASPAADAAVHTANGKTDAPQPVAPASTVPRRSLDQRMLTVFASVGMVVVALSVWFLAVGGVRQEIGAREATRSGWSGEIRLAQLTDEVPVRTAAISPDGRHIVFVQTETEGHGLHVRSIATNSDLLVAGPFETPLRGLAFSPDGDRVLYLHPETSGPGYSTLFEVPAMGGTPRPLIFDVDSAVTFSPDGESFAFIRGVPGETNRIMVARADGSEQRVVGEWKHPGILIDLDWSDDGRHIATSAWGPRTDAPFQIQVFAIDTGEAVAIGPRWDLLNGLSWLPGSSSLLVVGEPSGTADRGQLWEISFPEGRVQRISNDLGSYRGLSMTADGTAILTIRRERRSVLWSYAPDGTTDGRRWTTMFRPEDAVHWARSGPDGSAYFSTRETDRCRLWKQSGPEAEAESVTTGLSLMNPLFDVGPGGFPIVFMGPGEDGETPHVLGITDEEEAPVQITFGTGEARGAACAGGVVYTSIAEGGVWRADYRGGDPVKLSDLSPYSTPQPICSDDGRFVAFDASVPSGPGNGSRTEIRVRRIFLVDTEGDLPARSFDWPDGRLLQWGPGENTLTYVVDTTGPSELWSLDLESGEKKELFRSKGFIVSYDWTNDGSGILMSLGDGQNNLVLIQAD